ncbi:MAG: hypothetical protein ISR52_02230 [Rhodospirillales bacterium]|nr:hypothetical protein [Rhodospirillales bacterium]
MQLRKYLEDGGSGKLNVIAISWTEGRYGSASEKRLQRFVRDFHPDIRIIRETDKINKAFAPLVYVPANFVFDGTGKRAFGDGNREHLDQDYIRHLVDRLQ